MAELNVDTVNILNEADLPTVASPALTDFVHLTRGRKTSLLNIKTAVLAGESTAITDINVPTPTASTVTVQAITGPTTNSTTIPTATPTAAGVMSAAQAALVATIPVGGIDGSETILQNGTNVSITGTGTTADPYIVNSSGGGGSSNFRGTFSTLALLTSGVALPVAGDYADVDTNGTFSTRYIWDTTDGIWTTGVGSNALNHQFVIDEDSFVSNSDTKVPTQQSVKAYVDNSIASAGGGDMNKAIYDTGDNGIVDNSENLEGNDSAYHLDRANHTGTQAASTISDFDTEVTNNAAVAANTAKVTAHPLIDDDTLATATATNVASAESIKAYVDANAGGTSFVKSKIGNTSQAQIHSDSASAITYNVTTNVGTLTIPTFGDISSATIPVISGVDYTASGDFTLVVKYSDNSVNTWTTGSIADFDLYVPQFKFYDIGAHVAFQTGDMNGLNAQADAIDPTVEFGNGEVRFKFTNASTFGSFPQMFVQLQFPKI